MSHHLAQERATVSCQRGTKSKDVLPNAVEIRRERILGCDP